MTPLDEMVLVPRPRRVERLEGGAPVGSPVTTRSVPDLPAQGFRLTIDDGVHIDHADALGLRYAQQLLDQIAGQAIDGRLPGVRVEDHPDIVHRGFMLDISRDRVPTRATLVRLVELCALARYTQLQLYMEHTFTYRDHREVWQDASPMTPAHLTWLDGLCSDHGIELVPNQNCFGHMARWLALPRYRDRAECPDGWDLFPGVTLPPSVLAPTPENAAFALDLLAELLPSFRSRQVNIGCDEPFELGRGASADRVAAEGRGPVYVEHVTRLVEPLVDRGYTVQIWADVLRAHPDLARRLPLGTVPVAWCYEAPPSDDRPLALPPGVAEVMDRLGTDASTFSGFDPLVAPLADAGVPFWVAAGTSGWSSLVGRIDNACANLVDAAETASAHGCGGYLVTDWGDNGHHQPPSVSFGPLVFGGAVAWGLDANRDLPLADVLDRHVFADPTGRMSAALDRLGRQWSRTGQRAINGSPLSAALFPGEMHMVFGRPDRDAVRSVVAEVETAIADLARAAPGSDDGEITVRELTQAARMARHGAWRLLGDDGPSSQDLADDMAALVEGQLVSWMDRSRPGGLSDSLARLDPTLAARVEITPDDETDTR
ncbi:glycoside hydrolase [Iamia sp. SCSIO 61187]|uniref:glycoside hydrolase family 20 zincin-like fold domain-containing protein n=1 Tax=Iamia sp. SCSIO 61187 TaxID=2722752 RepID=UPI001C626370|nr:glycoside hydrolase family 20 zincin-like fold domain-containing protein [Iamia sp. SCSIO 61187]QYG93254.1 glycoside hydrolase [Iamia sp. SCSIO 61187]